MQQGKVSWTNIKGFKITENTQLVAPQYRIIDVLYYPTPLQKQRLEMKSWSDWNANWSDDVFATQFVKDLQQVTDIDEELRWRFDQRGNFTDAVWLKEKIVNALKSKGVTLLNSIPESNNKDKIRIWFGVPVGLTPAVQFEMADIDYFFSSDNKFTLIFQN